MRNERGFVALFTCIILSLLLLVITMSLVSLEALQLRKSEDSEQTLRAYYAAEAGIEDAAAKVMNGTITTDQTCQAQTGFDSSGAAGWTCQQVSFSGNPTGTLKASDQAKTIDPGAKTYNNILVEWNQSSSTDPGFYNVGSSLPSQAAYNHVPMIELAMVQYPNTAFRANDPALKLTNALIVPRGATGGTFAYASAAAGQQFSGNCGPGSSRNTGVAGIVSGYNCWAHITGINTSSLNYLFRIRSRYGPSSYKMTFLNGNTVVPVPDGTATIDVTAKAGQTYRRVISKLPLNASAASGLNYVMYSDTNICKGFDVMNNLPGPGCPYL